MSHPLSQALDDLGFVIVPAVFAPSEIDEIVATLHAVFDRDTTNATLRSADGHIYGARNLLQLWPGVLDLCKRGPIPTLLQAALGCEYGLVRVLYFDKPPEHSWALPWHKDMTIAVKNHRLPSNQFAKPTFKAGVPHVEAPEWLLQRMLTVRLHLDDMTEENGPLKVIPRSHRNCEDASPETILGQRGDVLLMRPLLSHASNRSHSETKRHRRILHFEMSGVVELPDGFEWHDFVRP